MGGAWTQLRGSSSSFSETEMLDRSVEEEAVSSRRCDCRLILFCLLEPNRTLLMHLSTIVRYTHGIFVDLVDSVTSSVASCL